MDYEIYFLIFLSGLVVGVGGCWIWAHWAMNPLRELDYADNGIETK